MGRGGEVVRTKLEQWAWVLPFLAAAALWEGVGRAGIVPSSVFPPFSGVVARLAAQLRGPLLPAAGVTLAGALAAFGLALLAGLPLWLWLRRRHLARRALAPLFWFLALSFGVSSVGLSPFLVVWLGLGVRTLVVETAFKAFEVILLLATTSAPLDLTVRLTWLAAWGAALAGDMAVNLGGVLGGLYGRAIALMDTRAVFAVLVAGGLAGLAVDRVIVLANGLAERAWTSGMHKPRWLRYDDHRR